MDQIQEVLPSRLRTMLLAIKLDKSKKRTERIDVYNRLNDRFNDWVDQHKELGFEVMRDSKFDGVEVNVVGFDDGAWMYGYSVMLSDRGCGSAINPQNDMFGSREEAVRAGVAHAMRYLLEQIERNDVNETVSSQVKKFIKASVEVVLGQKPKQTALF